MNFSPRIPERIVRRERVEEVSDLVHVIGARGAAKHVPQQVQRRISKAVGAAKHGQSVLLDAACPEILHAGSGEAFGVLIPETEVQIDTGRDSGLKVIPIPLPARFADHGRNVVGREA